MSAVPATQTAQSLAAQAPVSHDYTYWQRALELTGGKRSLSRDEMKSLGLTDDPGLGFFRKRMSRGGPFTPVAIWQQDGELFALVGGKSADAWEMWSYAAPHPVTEEAYHAKMDGGVWPDEDLNVTASLEAPAAGDNNPPEDEADILKAQIDAASANAEAYKEIGDDETAGKAQSARSRLLELRGTADKRREALVRPHLDAQKAVNDLWQPLVKAAKAAADGIAKALGDYETLKDKLAKAAAKKAEDERLARIEQARQEALEASPVTGTQAVLPPEPPPPAPAPAPTMQVRGAYGRAAAVKTTKVVTEVTDWDALFGFMKNHAEVKEYLKTMAQRAVDRGFEVPGVTIEERKKVV